MSDSISCFYVHYSDETTVTYYVEGDRESLVAIDCPGELTFCSSGAVKVTNFMWRRAYRYTYTENEITSEEFEFVVFE